MEFIKLHVVHTERADKSVYINVAHLIEFAPLDKGSIIWVIEAGSDGWHVRETPEQILKLIREAGPLGFTGSEDRENQLVEKIAAATGAEKRESDERAVAKEIDDVLRELQTPFFDADTFFKEKRMERMRPNLSRNDSKEYDVEAVAGSLAATGYFADEDS